MRILRPLHNKVSEPVRNWSEIKEEARKIQELIRAGNYEGHFTKAYAIHHCQVSENPKSYFVVNDDLKKRFGHWCIVNLEIIQKKDPCTFPEGCMSFMYREVKRVDRYASIKVKYWTPFLGLFLVPRKRHFKENDIETYVCQHEYDHSKGKNIYNK